MNEYNKKDYCVLEKEENLYQKFYTKFILYNTIKNKKSAVNRVIVALFC